MSQMSKEEQVLFEQVYVPAFIQKCASRGVSIKTAEALSAAIETTALVKHYLASQEENRIKSAATKLKTALGVPAAEAKKAQATASKSAAYELAQNPQVRQAVLALQK